MSITVLFDTSDANASKESKGQNASKVSKGQTAEDAIDLSSGEEDDEIQGKYSGFHSTIKDQLIYSHMRREPEARLWRREAKVKARLLHPAVLL